MPPPPNPRHRSFVDRIFAMRVIGLGTAGVAIAGALHPMQPPAWTWIVLALNCYAWPFVAWRLARRSRDLRAAEFRNLAIDSACGGFWMAVMQFNLLPSLLLLVMLSIDKISIGGWKLLARTAPVQLAVALATWAALGFPLQPQTGTAVIVACIPFLMFYPLALSTAAYTLGRRVRRQNRQLEATSRIDPLTGLPNRTELELAAERELARFARNRVPGTLLMLDVDRFKQINDRLGHPTGDLVLRRVAAALDASLRKSDVAGRLAGDEFAIVLPNTRPDEALDVAERMRTAVAALRFDDPTLRCSISIGLAGLTPGVATWEDWMSAADTALYQAKRAGRNRIGQQRNVAPAAMEEAA